MTTKLTFFFCSKAVGDWLGGRMPVAIKRVEAPAFRTTMGRLAWPLQCQCLLNRIRISSACLSHSFSMSNARHAIGTRHAPVEWGSWDQPWPSHPNSGMNVPHHGIVGISHGPTAPTAEWNVDIVGARSSWKSEWIQGTAQWLVQLNKDIIL